MVWLLPCFLSTNLQTKGCWIHPRLASPHPRGAVRCWPEDKAQTRAVSFGDFQSPGLMLAHSFQQYPCLFGAVSKDMGAIRYGDSHLGEAVAGMANHGAVPSWLCRHTLAPSPAISSTWIHFLVRQLSWQELHLQLHSLSVLPGLWKWDGDCAGD